MRRNLVAGNWKMNTSFREGISLAKEIVGSIESKKPEILIFPSFIHLSEIQNNVSGHFIQVGAQNCHHKASGAYTGEISAAMLQSIGISHVLIGHSERRNYFNETDDILNAKVQRALEASLQVIYCCGEPENIRTKGQHIDFIQHQLENVVFNCSKKDLEKITIAYEPIWAIGTGKVASPEQAQEVHQSIRSTIQTKYGEDAAHSIRIIYGGSCKPDNATALAQQPDIDGALVGGASLNATDFISIVNAFV